MRTGRPPWGLIEIGSRRSEASWHTLRWSLQCADEVPTGAGRELTSPQRPRITLVAFSAGKGWESEGVNVAQQRFADHQRKAMLRAIHERKGRWDEVDPDTEIARIGEGIGLSEDQSYDLFGQLVDEGFVDTGRAYRAGGAMPGSISRIVGREENMTVIGDELRLTDKGRSEVG